MWKLIALLVAVVCPVGAAFAQDAENDAETLFHNLDSNQDGSLTRDEVGTTEEGRLQFKRLLTLADQNNDEKISLTEFLRELSPSETPADKERPAERPGGPQGEGRTFSVSATIFKNFDRNRDGKLALEELPDPLKERLGPAYTALGQTSMSAEEFETAYGLLVQETREQPGLPAPEAFFGQFDKNKDDKITVDEVPEEHRVKMQKFFERFEADFITREDYARLVERSRRPNERNRPEGRPEASQNAVGGNQTDRPGSMRRPEEAEGQRRGPAFFVMLDQDRDGKLSAAELSQAAQLVSRLDEDQDSLLDPSELFGFRRGAEGRDNRGGPGPRRGRPDTAERTSDRPQRPAVSETPNTTVEQPKPETNATGRPPADLRNVSDAEFAERFFVRYDGDRDGQLTAEEAPDQLLKNFLRLDANADGTISKDELTKAFANRNR